MNYFDFISDLICFYKTNDLAVNITADTGLIGLYMAFLNEQRAPDYNIIMQQ